jgi:hypothetical protein
MSQNGQFNPSHSDLISAISNFNKKDNQQTQRVHQASSMSLLNLNFGDCSNLMNLNGYFLPNNCLNKSDINLNVVGSNDFLYVSGESETTSKSSPLQSTHEISSPESLSNNFKTSVNNSQNQLKISPSIFESEDNLTQGN